MKLFDDVAEWNEKRRQRKLEDMRNEIALLKARKDVKELELLRDIELKNTHAELEKLREEYTTVGKLKKSLKDGASQIANNMKVEATNSKDDVKHRKKVNKKNASRERFEAFAKQFSES